MNCLKTFCALAASALLAAFTSASFAEDAERPARIDAAVVMLEATVAAIDHDTREVTLEGADGNTVTITAGEEVKNLAQVDVGDKVNVEYMEIVALEVMPRTETEIAAMTTTMAEKTAPLGEKPAATAIEETKAITVVEAIDKENQTVTLRGPDGKSATVKARNPANLEKIVVGDKVLVTHTTAAAISVTEK